MVQRAHDELTSFEGVLWVTGSSTTAAKETIVPEEGVDEACDAAWHDCKAAHATVSAVVAAARGTLQHGWQPQRTPEPTAVNLFRANVAPGEPAVCLLEIAPVGVQVRRRPTRQTTWEQAAELAQLGAALVNPGVRGRVTRRSPRGTR